MRIALTLAVVAGLAGLSLFIGARTIPAPMTWEALTRFDPANGQHLLIWQLRVPRTVLAIGVGAAMGLAGVLMQTLGRNPLADPGLLGINAGAALAVVAMLALGSGTGLHIGAALLGAALAGAAVAGLARLTGGNDPMRLVLAGAALSAVLAGLAQTVILNSDQAVLDQFRFWAVGSLQGRGMGPALLVLGTAAVAGGAARVMAPMLDALSLGADKGRSLGADGPAVWSMLGLLVVVLAAITTAAVGPIGFAGLVAGHVARGICGPVHRRLIPLAMTAGAALVLLADTLGRIIARPSEIDAGIMCALIGAPFFLWLIRSGRAVRL